MSIINMSISGKVKTMVNKIEQNKAQYSLDRQNAKISALSSENVSKYEFFNWHICLTQKRLVRKATSMKRFQYFPLDKELKA